MVSESDLRLRGLCNPPAASHLPSGENRAARWFTYTAFGDLEDEVNCVDGDEFLTSHTYDDFGRQGTVTYPQVSIDSPRMSLRYNYTSLGFLYFIDDPSDNSLYWAATARDASGRVTSEYTRNGVETTSIRSQWTGWLMRTQSIAHADGIP